MPSIKHAREEFIGLVEYLYLHKDINDEDIDAVEEQQLPTDIKRAFKHIQEAKIPHNADNSFAKDIAESYLRPIINQVVQLDSRTDGTLESSLNKCMAEAAASLADGFLGDKERASLEQNLANHSFFNGSSSLSSLSSEDETFQTVLLESCALGAICK